MWDNVGGETVPDVWQASMPGDTMDTAKMQPFTTDKGLPWWESVAAYGLTRAIDNRFGPVQTSGNVYPGSSAGGVTGKTYQNAPSNNRGQTSGPAAEGVSASTLLLLGAAAVAAYLIARG
jgi:hypothetical protein